VSVAMHSDQRRERRLHVAAVSATGAVGLLLASQATTPLGGLLALCLTACGIWSVMGPFWALATATLSNTAAAGGIAFINAIGNLGGFFGPSIIGIAHERTQNFHVALAVLAIAPATLALLVLLVPKQPARGRGPEARG
jgi:ACS family tartrate transporter-like MFS transporter